MGKRTRLSEMMAGLQPAGDTTEGKPIEPNPKLQENNVHLNGEVYVNSEVNLKGDANESIMVEDNDANTDEVIGVNNVLNKVDLNVDVNEGVIVAKKVEENVQLNVHIKSKRFEPKPNSFEAMYTRRTVFILNEYNDLIEANSKYKGDITALINEGLGLVFKKKNLKQKGK